MAKKCGEFLCFLNSPCVLKSCTYCEKFSVLWPLKSVSIQQVLQHAQWGFKSSIRSRAQFSWRQPPTTSLSTSSCSVTRSQCSYSQLQENIFILSNLENNLFHVLICKSVEHAGVPTANFLRFSELSEISCILCRSYFSSCLKENVRGNEVMNLNNWKSVAIEYCFLLNCYFKDMCFFVGICIELQSMSYPSN